MLFALFVAVVRCPRSHTVDAPEWMNNSFPNFKVTEFEGAAGASYGGESKFMTARPGGSHPVPPEMAKRDLPIDQPPISAQLQEARNLGT